MEWNKFRFADWKSFDYNYDGGLCIRALNEYKSVSFAFGFNEL